MAPFRHQRDETPGHIGAPVTKLDEVPPPGAAPAGGPQPATVSPQPATPGAVEPGQRDEPPLVVPKTRTSAAYAGIAIGLLVLVLVIVLITQNLRDASVHFITLHFRLPIGLLILASAVAGGIIVLLVSAARVAQLRLMARRHRSGRPTN